MTEHTWELEQVGPSWHVRGPGARPDLWLDSEDHARLIAAAPDLLAACEEALRFIASPQGVGPHYDDALLARAQIEAAIHKARGQGP